MIRRYLVALGLAAALAACDDPTEISHLDKLPHMEAGDLVTMQETDGLLVEIHGTPWKGATDAALADALRPPAGGAQEISFRAVPTGQWVNGRGHRLVLHFNPTAAPNSRRDCLATAEMRTKAPAQTGFTVNATFCTGGDWLAHGYLQATKFEAGDWEEFTEVMRTLMMKIFQGEEDK